LLDIALDNSSRLVFLTCVSTATPNMRHQPLNPTAQPFVPPAPLPTLIPTARDQGPSPAACSLPQSSLAASTSRPKRISPLPPKPLLCKFFNAEGGCPSGQTCLFVHGQSSCPLPSSFRRKLRIKSSFRLPFSSHLFLNRGTELRRTPQRRSKPASEEAAQAGEGG
jgi:hypothetical protein